MYQYVLGANGLEGSSAEKDMGVLADAKSNTIQYRTLVAKAAAGILDCIRKVLPAD